MNNPRVSIIIPTYNRAHLIGETLDSILAQTYENWECIIVDDGSTDNSAEVIGNYVKKDSRFQHHSRPADKPKGANACRNYGFELSKGEYVNWFDDDDLMHETKLKIQLSALENEDYKFSVCQTLVFEESVKNIIGLRHEKIVSENSLLDFIKQNYVFLTPSALIKCDYLILLNLKFDEELQAAQEWEFFCRLLYYSPSYHSTKEPLVFIRKHVSSISYNPLEAAKRSWNYYLARQKVWCFVKDQKELVNKDEFTFYFKNYFTKYLVGISNTESFSRIFEVFQKGYVPFHSFAKSSSTFGVLLLMFLTSRGYKWIKKI